MTDGTMMHNHDISADRNKPNKASLNIDELLDYVINVSRTFFFVDEKELSLLLNFKVWY